MTTAHKILLTAHILAGVVLIGWLAMQSIFLPSLIRKGEVGVLRFAHGAMEKIGRATGLVALLGIALVFRSRNDVHYSFRQGWLAASLVLFIAAAVIGAVFESGAVKTAIERLEGGQQADDIASRVAVLGYVNAAILTTVLFLMVAKPGY